MKGEMRQPAAAAARHSLPTAEATKRAARSPTTPAATNKRSTRHSTTTQSLDTRQPKSHKTQHAPQPTTKRDEEHKEKEDDQASDTALTSLCSLVDSLTALHSQTSLPNHVTVTSRYQSLLSSLHRLSPPTALSSHRPPSAAASTAARSAADQLVSIARAMQTSMPSNPLLHSQLQQLQSALLPLSASDMYALLLSASVTLCQLLTRSTASHSSQLQAAGTADGQLSQRYVEHVTGLFGTELDALRKEGESSVGAACLPLLAQSVQHIITAHLPNDTAAGDSARTLLLADLQLRAAT